MTKTINTYGPQFINLIADCLNLQQELDAWDAASDELEGNK